MVTMARRATRDAGLISRALRRASAEDPESSSISVLREILRKENMTVHSFVRDSWDSSDAKNASGDISSKGHDRDRVWPPLPIERNSGSREDSAVDSPETNRGSEGHEPGNMLNDISKKVLITTDSILSSWQRRDWDSFDSIESLIRSQFNGLRPR